MLHKAPLAFNPMFTSKRSVAALISAIISLVAPLLTAPSADAAQTLAQVQARVRQLEEEATTAAEGAQEAKVKISLAKRPAPRHPGEGCGAKSER